jgi:transcriptional regulator with XRE-family HTH domain
MTVTAFGGLLRHHRRQRGLSQLALASRVETTTRHLSYVENGRSRPGREIVLRLADALELPLRSRNELSRLQACRPSSPPTPSRAQC